MVLEILGRLVFKDILDLLVVKVLLVPLEIQAQPEILDNGEILEIRAQEGEDQLARQAIMEGRAQPEGLVQLDLDLLAHKEFEGILDQPVQVKLVKWGELGHKETLGLLVQLAQLAGLDQLGLRGHKEILGLLVVEEKQDLREHMDILV
jgi:hypothetical protein